MHIIQGYLTVLSSQKNLYRYLLDTENNCLIQTTTSIEWLSVLSDYATRLLNE